MSSPALADLFDAHAEALALLALSWRSFGGCAAFSGPVQTLACFEDNSFVRSLLEEKGEGRRSVTSRSAEAMGAFILHVVGAD